MPQASISVLHVTASSMIGGGPEHVWQLVRHLPNSIESFIAAPMCEPYGSRFIASVGHERFLAIPQRKFTLSAFFRLVAFIKKHNIHIIHSHGKGAGIYGRLAALLAGVKSVHTFHGIHLPQKSLLRKFYMALERALCSVSKVCIAVSDGEAEEAKRCKFALGNLQIIYNGVYVPEQLAYREMPMPFTILHVSRFDRVKNSLMLFDIAIALQKKNLLTQVKFILVGEGEELVLLQDKVVQAGLVENFEYAGRQESVQPFYEEAACFLSTSLREGMPLAVLEAQAFGVPAVVSDVVGNRDAVIHKETGFLYSLDNIFTASSYIQQLLENEKMWQSMRHKSYSYIRKIFSIQKMVLRTNDVYKTLIVKNDI